MAVVVWSFVSYDVQNSKLQGRLIGEERATVDIEFRGEDVVVAVAYFE